MGVCVVGGDFLIFLQFLLTSFHDTLRWRWTTDIDGQRRQLFSSKTILANRKNKTIIFFQTIQNFAFTGIHSNKMTINWPINDHHSYRRATDRCLVHSNYLCYLNPSFSPFVILSSPFTLCRASNNKYPQCIAVSFSKWLHNTLVKCKSSVFFQD